MLAARFVLAIFLSMLSSNAATAGEIVFFCTDALAPSMRELVPEFERAGAHRVKMSVANAGTIAARLQQGEAADLAIVLPAAWDRLQQDGRIDPAVRVVLGKVGLGAFVRRGADRPDIGTVEAFKRTIVTAGSVAVRDPAQRSPVGTYMLALFERLALTDVVTPKLVLTPNPPYEVVIMGKVDLGFSTLAEILAERRVELVGPLPREIQNYNVFVTAIPIASAQRDATGEFLRFLASDSSKAVLRSGGIDSD
jgi:molybdate transport system substrate-binding protein